jgi:hypothetical protein
MLSSTVTLNEVSYSFNAALESLGDVVRDVIYNTLERNGIGVQDIPLRIPDVVAILRKTVGGTAGLIIRKMLAEFRNERFKARTRYQQDSYYLGEIHPVSVGRSVMDATPA